MDTKLEDLDADSIDVVEMIMALEDAYDVEFPEEGLESLVTFGELVTALYEHLEKVKMARLRDTVARFMRDNGLDFHNPGLIDMALTHPSFSQEKELQPQ